MKDDISLKHLEIITTLTSSHTDEDIRIGGLTIDEVKECDRLVELLGLDFDREVWFA